MKTFQIIILAGCTAALAASAAAPAAQTPSDFKVYVRVAERKALNAAVTRATAALANPLAAPALQGALKNAPAGQLLEIECAPNAARGRRPVPRPVTNAAALARFTLRKDEMVRVFLPAESVSALRSELNAIAATNEELRTSIAAHRAPFDNIAAFSGGVKFTDAGLEFAGEADLVPGGAWSKMPFTPLTKKDLDFAKVPDSAHAFGVDRTLGFDDPAAQVPMIRSAMFEGPKSMFAKFESAAAKKKDAAERKKFTAELAALRKLVEVLLTDVPQKPAGVRGEFRVCTDKAGRMSYTGSISGYPGVGAYAEKLGAETVRALDAIRPLEPKNLASFSVRRKPGELVLALDAAKLVEAMTDDSDSAKVRTNALRVVKAAFGGDRLVCRVGSSADALSITLAGSSCGKPSACTGRAARRVARALPEIATRNDLVAVEFLSIYTLLRNYALGLINAAFDRETIEPYDPILNQLPDTGDAGIGAFVARRGDRIEGAIRISSDEIRGFGATGMAFVSYQMASAMGGSDDDDDDDDDGDDDGEDDDGDDDGEDGEED